LSGKFIRKTIEGPKNIVDIFNFSIIKIRGDNVCQSTNEKFSTTLMCTSKRCFSQEEWRISDKTRFFLESANQFPTLPYCLEREETFTEKMKRVIDFAAVRAVNGRDFSS